MQPVSVCMLGVKSSLAVRQHLCFDLHMLKHMLQNSCLMFSMHQYLRRNPAAFHCNAVLSLTTCLSVVQAVGVPTGVATLASVANEMAVQAGCNTVLPLIRDLYPAQYSSADSLQLTQAELQSIPAMDPKLASCVGA